MQELVRISLATRPAFLKLLATLQVKHEAALAQNVKEMQQNAIHLRHPGCRLANQTCKGLDDMLRAVQEAELSGK